MKSILILFWLEKHIKMYKLVWKLYLNPMRNHTEDLDMVAWSESKELLLQWYHSQRVASYADIGEPSFACHGRSHHWNKSFQKGGPLEWYNPMFNETDGNVHQSFCHDGIQRAVLGHDSNCREIRVTDIVKE
jgi:hypothetical protein